MATGGDRGSQPCVGWEGCTLGCMLASVFSALPVHDHVPRVLHPVNPDPEEHPPVRHLPPAQAGQVPLRGEGHRVSLLEEGGEGGGEEGGETMYYAR